MTTVGLHAERLVELKLRAELCECLAKQNAELEELMEMHAKAEGVVERQNEYMAERVDEICKSHALGIQGPTLSKLGRIECEMRQLRDYRERFERLVKLCMDAPRDSFAGNDRHLRAIVAESDRITSEGVPF